MTTPLDRPLSWFFEMPKQQHNIVRRPAEDIGQVPPAVDVVHTVDVSASIESIPEAAEAIENATEAAEAIEHATEAAEIVGEAAVKPEVLIAVGAVVTVLLACAIVCAIHQHVKHKKEQDVLSALNDDMIPRVNEQEVLHSTIAPAGDAKKKNARGQVSDADVQYETEEDTAMLLDPEKYKSAPSTPRLSHRVTSFFEREKESEKPQTQRPQNLNLSDISSPVVPPLANWRRASSDMEIHNAMRQRTKKEFGSKRFPMETVNPLPKPLRGNSVGRQEVNLVDSSEDVKMDREFDRFAEERARTPSATHSNSLEGIASLSQSNPFLPEFVNTSEPLLSAQQRLVEQVGETLYQGEEANISDSGIGSPNSPASMSSSASQCSTSQGSTTLSPIHCWYEAIQQGKDAVDDLIRQGSDINTNNRGRSNTPLQFAVRHSTLEIVEYLLEVGANINAVGRNGRSALHTAAECDREDMVDLLIKRGIDVNLQGANGRTSLDDAKSHNSTDVIDVLRSLVSSSPSSRSSSPASSGSGINSPQSPTSRRLILSEEDMRNGNARSQLRKTGLFEGLSSLMSTPVVEGINIAEVVQGA